MYPSTLSQVQKIVSGESNVPNQKTGTSRPYDDNFNKFDMHVIDDKEKFEETDAEFRRIVDADGTPLIDVAKRYWDDPEFAEHQRRQIAEGKRNRGRN